MNTRRLAAFAAVLTACPAIAAPGLPTAFDATGTWSGELAIGGVSQALTVQLHRAGDGSLLGYVVGGTSGRTLTGGFQDETTITFDIEIADPVQARTITFTGEAEPASLAGEVDDAGAVTPVSFEPVKPALFERRFLFATLPGGGDPGPPVEVAVAGRKDKDKSKGKGKGKDRFAGGAFVGRLACDLFACGGAVTGFATGDDGLGNEVVTMSLATGGDCPGAGSLEAIFDEASRLYTGTYTFQDCEDAVAEIGNVVGVRTTRTTSRHAAAVLESFARLAGALESGAPVGPSDVPLTPDYEHLGATLNDRLAEFNQEIATYQDIDVEFSRFRNLHTVNVPFAFEEAPSLFGVDFTDRRTGSAGGMTETYRHVDTTDGADALRFLAEAGADWLMHGNQVTHDLPIADYTIGAAQVMAPVASADIGVSIGPWGAHHAPHTGHLEGNAKADWMGLYATGLEQLSELGGGDGICDPGDTCGIAEADVAAGIIDYVAPAAPFEITHVSLERLESPGIYFGTDEHWRVRARIAYYTYDFVHLRAISTDLRDAMMNAGYTDPWTVHAPSGNLVTGEAVVLAAGETIAQPQVAAEEIPGHPGWFRGRFGVPQAPWQQMEFFTRNEHTGRQDSYYTWLAPALREALAAVLETEGLDPQSFRYDQPFLTERRWKAQMTLSNVDSMSRDDYSTVFSALGGWWENTPGACDGASIPCDELFSIFPIRKDTAFYDPALYDAPSVSYLAVHAFHDDMPPTRYGEVIAPAEPDPLSDILTIHWRDFDGTDIGYQAIAYTLDPAGRVLRIAWGAPAPFPGAVVHPAIPAVDDACDGVNLTCHDHQRPSGK